jgi:hypothetical protein
MTRIKIIVDGFDFVEDLPKLNDVWTLDSSSYGVFEHEAGIEMSYGTFN